MYLKKIVMKHVGPIKNVVIDMPFHESNHPKPLILVGENGSGKTVFLSQIVDALYEIHKRNFSDVLPIIGQSQQLLYKLAGSINCSVGKERSCTLLQFSTPDAKRVEYYDKSGEWEQKDFQQLISGFSLAPQKGKDKDISPTFSLDRPDEKFRKSLRGAVHLYQPAYRHEVPYWRVVSSMLSKPSLQDRMPIRDELGKSIEVLQSQKENISYLLNLALDYCCNPASKHDSIKWDIIQKMLQTIMDNKKVRLYVGRRGTLNRMYIGDEKKEVVIPSIAYLSQGQAVLFHLFLNIIRYADPSYFGCSDICGMVLIDEIDLHLHTNLQHRVLPKLIQMFPRVQFIVTTHSPLFVLGMQDLLGDEGFQLINMPDGKQITSERFSEFKRSFDVFKKTASFEDEITERVASSSKPLLFVEGKTDEDYIKKAAALLGEEASLQRIEILPVGGKKDLNHVFRLYEKGALPKQQPVFLLYDCDTNKEAKDYKSVKIRAMPFIKENPIKKGIENLFPKETIERIRGEKPQYIDHESAHSRAVRGTEEEMPETFSVNKDEKTNLSQWLCHTGTQKDFANFKAIFSMIDKHLLNTKKC